MKRGRPKDVENPVRVSVRVEAEDYDYLDQISRQSGNSIPKLIRQAISVLTNRPQGQTSAY